MEYIDLNVRAELLTPNWNLQNKEYHKASFLLTVTDMESILNRLNANKFDKIIALYG